MGRASGRAFSALGEGLLGWSRQREARELEKQREEQRQKERTETLELHAKERTEDQEYRERTRAEDQARADDAARRALLQQPGAREVPDTVSRMKVQPVERPPTLNMPDMTQLPGIGGTRSAAPPSARETLFGSKMPPPLPGMETAPALVEEPYRSPAGYTRPMAGIEFNPHYAEEYQEKQNEALAVAGGKAGLPHAGLLRYTGPSGVSSLINAEDRGPPPGSPAWKEMRLWEKQNGLLGRSGTGGAGGVTDTALYTANASAAREYIREMNRINAYYREYGPDTGETEEHFLARKAADIAELNSLYEFNGPADAHRVIRLGDLAERKDPDSDSTAVNTSVNRPPGSFDLSAQQSFESMFTPAMPGAPPPVTSQPTTTTPAPATPAPPKPTTTAVAPPMPGAPPALPALGAYGPTSPSRATADFTDVAGGGSTTAPAGRPDPARVQQLYQSLTSMQTSPDDSARVNHVGVMLAGGVKPAEVAGVINLELQRIETAMRDTMQPPQQRASLRETRRAYTEMLTNVLSGEETSTTSSPTNPTAPTMTRQPAPAGAPPPAAGAPGRVVPAPPPPQPAAAAAPALSPLAPGAQPRNKQEADAAPLTAGDVMKAQQRLRGHPRSTWEQVLRQAQFSKTQIDQIIGGAR